MRHARPLLILVLLAGCAARTPVLPPQPLQAAQTAALTVGELVLGIRQIERTAYQGTLIPQATHERAQDAILVALRSAQTFERAVTAWTLSKVPDPPAAVVEARRAMVAALGLIDEILAQYPEVRGATNAVRRALGVTP